MKKSILNQAINLTLLSTILGWQVGQPAWAQNNQEDEALALDDVKVTARKTEESLQEVPVAVSTFSREELQEAQAESLDSLNGAVPNMNLVLGRGSSSSANVYIRGIGQPDALQTFDPGVGIYIDGVYLSRIQGALMNLYDVERIEVLRGPQGTLYGKNTIGGAINVVTRQATGETTGTIQVLAGDYGKTSLNAYYAGAVSNSTNFSISTLYGLDNGFVTDPITQQHYNDRDNTSFRVKFNSANNDRFNWQLTMDYTNQENALSLGNPEATLVAVDLAGGVVPLYVPSGEEFDFQSSSSFRNDENQELRHWGISFIIDYDINDVWQMRSITAHRDLQSDSFIDIDASTLELGDVFVGVDQNQFSQELQMLFNNGNGLSGVIGAYYMQEDVPSYQEAYADDFLLYDGFPLDFLRTIADDLETTSYALFTQANWQINDRWGMSAGIRYSKDEKKYFRTTSTLSDAGAFLNGTFSFNDKDSWDSVTPMISVDYQINDNHMLYTSVSKGFKSGGFNGRANGASDVSSFKPETVWTYEFGGKSTFLNNRLRANYAVFSSDYEDFQARVAEDISSFPVINAAELSIQGAEIELAWLISTNTYFNSAIGYMDAEYDQFFDFRRPDEDRSDDIPPFSPEWTFNLGFHHNIPISTGGNLRLSTQASYIDDMYLSVDNQEALTQEGYWVYNAHATYEFANPAWALTIGGKNLGDEVYKVEAQEFSSVGNIQTAYYGAPRTWYAAITYNF